MSLAVFAGLAGGMAAGLVALGVWVAAGTAVRPGCTGCRGIDENEPCRVPHR